MAFRVSLLTIGSELLDGYVVDSNTAWIASRLAEQGLRAGVRLSVRDTDAEILDALAWLAPRSDAVIITGGLGPTGDDRTRECVSRFSGKALVFREDLWDDIRAKVLRFRPVVPEQNRNQAMALDGSEVLLNPRGTAPGFILPGTPVIAAFPGVPSELFEMFPAFQAYLERQSLVKPETASVWIKTVGLGESAVDEELQKINDPAVVAGTVAHPGQVDVRLDIKLSALGGKSQLEYAQEKMASFTLINRKTFSTDREESLAAAVVRLLKAQGRKLVTAESCTGGLLSKLITDVPGSSAVFWGGAVTYDNLLKQRLLDVSRQTLEKHGAVSFETAAEMLEGLRGIAESDYAISITGIAGPDGGTEEKPVGLVYIGFRTSLESAVLRFRITGSRDMVRTRAAYKALEILWEDLAHGGVDYDNLQGLEGRRA